MNENLKKGIVRVTDNEERKKIKQQLLERMVARNASTHQEFRERESARLNPWRGQGQSNDQKKGRGTAQVASGSGARLEADGTTGDVAVALIGVPKGA